MRRNLIFYAVLIGIFGSLLWFVFNQGAKAEAQQSRPTSVESAQVEAAAQQGPLAAIFRDVSQKLGDPFSLLLIQIVTIVLSSKLLASLASRIGQPVVIGEIVAGILLGPSALGHFLPGVSNFIFRADSLPNLNFLS